VHLSHHEESGAASGAASGVEIGVVNAAKATGWLSENADAAAARDCCSLKAARCRIHLRRRHPHFL